MHVQLVSSVSAGRLQGSLLGTAAAAKQPVLFHTTNYPCPRRQQPWTPAVQAVLYFGQKNIDARSTYGIRIAMSLSG